MEQGLAELRGFCQLIEENESAAIYKFCLYEDLQGNRINNKTPWDLSNNFRFKDSPSAYGSPEVYGGNYGAMLMELKEMRKELNALKNQEPAENELGMIGRIMENEALQPLIMGLVNKAADWIYSPAKGVGELKRVSGVPNAAEPPSPSIEGVRNWREWPEITQAIDSLNELEDLPALLQQLAKFQKTKPLLFKTYKGILMKMKF